MMRKIILSFFILLFFTSLPSTAFGADNLYRLLHAGSVESFKEDQDALIVGQFIDKTDDKLKVKVLKVISGKVDGETFLLQNDFHYGFHEGNPLPQLNEYSVMSLKKFGSFYKNALGVFKADSGDFKTLKLLTKETRYLYAEGDVAAIEWYVNSEGKENDFFFNAGSAYVRRPNGEELKIYPKEEVSTQTIIESKVENKTEMQTKVALGSPAKFIVPIIFILALFSFIFVRLKKHTPKTNKN